MYRLARKLYIKAKKALKYESRKVDDVENTNVEMRHSSTTESTSEMSTHEPAQLLVSRFMSEPNMPHADMGVKLHDEYKSRRIVRVRSQQRLSTTDDTEDYWMARSRSAAARRPGINQLAEASPSKDGVFRSEVRYKMKS